MKKIFILIIVLSIAGFSCNRKCGVDKPKNIKPIDWENYNDVHTVKWNYTDDCSDFTFHNDTGKTIKMYGWMFHPMDVSPDLFCLLSDSLLVEANNPKCAMVYVGGIREEWERLKEKFDTSDLTKKCYVTGSLEFSNQSDNDCCLVTPSIGIMNADDIYFE